MSVGDQMDQSSHRLAAVSGVEQQTFAAGGESNRCKQPLVQLSITRMQHAVIDPDVRTGHNTFVTYHLRYSLSGVEDSLSLSSLITSDTEAIDWDVAAHGSKSSQQPCLSRCTAGR